MYTKIRALFLALRILPTLKAGSDLAARNPLNDPLMFRFYVHYTTLLLWSDAEFGLLKLAPWPLILKGLYSL